MRVRVKSSGQSRLRRQLRRLPKDMTAEIKTEMDAAGKALRDEIVAKAPKDQGDLAQAAHYRVSNDGLGVSVGFSTKSGFLRKWKAGGFVALFQEYGTRHHAAQPFIRPAWRAKIAGILDSIDATVSRVIRNLKS